MLILKAHLLVSVGDRSCSLSDTTLFEHIGFLFYRCVKRALDGDHSSGCYSVRRRLTQPGDIKCGQHNLIHLSHRLSAN